jgi:aminoglycoside phosphotransferase (APT) family kinase protein
LVQLLSDRGWPFPAIRDVVDVGDFTVTHEDFVSGDHPGEITEASVRELIRLSRTSRETPHQRSDWSDWLLDNLSGADPKISPDALQASEFGRTLVRETAQTLAVRDLRGPCRAVIHADFSPGNTLVSADGSIVGVVDWEGVTVGDSAFDLVTLEWDLELWGRSVRHMLPVLREELNKVSSSRTRRAYRLYLTCRNLSWAAGSSDERNVVATARRILALESPEA